MFSEALFLHPKFVDFVERQMSILHQVGEHPRIRHSAPALKPKPITSAHIRCRFFHQH